MSIRNLLQPNNFQLADHVFPTGGADNQILAVTDESTKTVEWVNRSINGVFQSRNNLVNSDVTGPGVPTKAVAALPQILDLGGGYSVKPGGNIIQVNDVLNSTSGIATHQCLITIAARAVSPPPTGIRTAWYVWLSEALPSPIPIIDTEVHARLMPNQIHSIVINCPITLGPNIAMSLYWNNLSDGSSMLIEDITWSMQYLGNS